MSLSAIIKYLDLSGKQSSQLLHAGQIQIGTRANCGIVLPREDGVFDFHCEIILHDEKCIFYDLTRGKGGTRINDCLATSLQELHDQDVIQIGKRKIEITLYGKLEEVVVSSQSANAAEREKPEANEAEPLPTPILRVLPSGLHTYQLSVEDPERLNGWVSEAVGDRMCCLTLNSRSVGVEPEEIGKVDLLDDYPDDIKSDHSLSFTWRDTYDGVRDEFDAWKDKDCSLLLVPTKSETKENLENTTLVPQALWMWLLKPSRFYFHMSQGDRHFLSSIFEAFELVIARETPQTPVTVCANKEALPSWD